MFQINIVNKFKSQILCFFFKLCRLLDNVEKYYTAVQATCGGACALHAA